MSEYEGIVWFLYSIVFSSYFLYAFEGEGARDMIQIIRRGSWRKNYQDCVRLASDFLSNRYPTSEIDWPKINLRSLLSLKLFSDLHIFFVFLWALWIPIFWLSSEYPLKVGDTRMLWQPMNGNPGGLPVLSVRVILAGAALVGMLIVKSRCFFLFWSFVFIFSSILIGWGHGSSILSLSLCVLFAVHSFRSRFDFISYIYSMLPFLLLFSIFIRSYFKLYIIIPVFFSVSFFNENDLFKYFASELVVVISLILPSLYVWICFYFVCFFENKYGFSFWRNLLFSFSLFPFVIILIYDAERKWYFSEDAFIGPVLFPLILVTGSALSTYVAVMVTRYCLFRGAKSVGWNTLGWAVLDFSLAVAGAVLTVVISTFFLQLLNLSLPSSVLNLDLLLEGLAESVDTESRWILLAPMISFMPTALHALVAIAITVPSIIKRSWRERFASLLDRVKNNRAKNWFVLVPLSMFVSLHLFVIIMLFEMIFMQSVRFLLVG